MPSVGQYLPTGRLPLWLFVARRRPRACGEKFAVINLAREPHVMKQANIHAIRRN
jgi:hypothetical protein